jgi:hypothetical protein
MCKLLLDQAILPSHLQVFVGLDNILLQLISLGSNELLDLLYHRRLGGALSRVTRSSRRLNMNC